MNAGIQFAATVGVCAALGWWLDRRYGWGPWGTVGCAALGVVAAFYYFLKETLSDGGE